MLYGHPSLLNPPPSVGCGVRQQSAAEAGSVGAAGNDPLAWAPVVAWGLPGLERGDVDLRALAARPEQVESLTLEFKREYSKSLVTTIAAMANTYGGVILVGVNDKVEPGIERVVGVDTQDTIDRVASGWPREGGPALGTDLHPRPVRRRYRAQCGGDPGRCQRRAPAPADRPEGADPARACPADHVTVGFLTRCSRHGAG
ncbi:ATP-binding protein [Streptomyces sparsogenes]|uniref:AlbA family DNA-binding domain-containing protein n=1 Tax=Streptomyces sparsogenes TaxID=67365 RepID=UPI0033D7E95E